MTMLSANCQKPPTTFQNPILSGFNPDFSIEVINVYQPLTGILDYIMLPMGYTWLLKDKK